MRSTVINERNVPYAAPRLYQFAVPVPNNAAVVWKPTCIAIFSAVQFIAEAVSALCRVSGATNS